MGIFKTLIKLVVLIVVLVIAVPICIYVINEADSYSSNSNEKSEYSYPTGVEGLKTITHQQENIQPGYFWAIPVELGFNEKLYANVQPQSPIKTMWMSNWDFQRFKEGKGGYEFYDLGTNGSNGWKRLEYDGIGTWYLVFNNDTNHMKTVNVELIFTII